MMWVILNNFLVFFLLFFCSVTQAQVDIKEQSKDGYIRVERNEEALTKEIYTSMHQLSEFFEEEKNYVEDIKAIIDKKLVSQAAVTGLGNYKIYTYRLSKIRKKNLLMALASGAKNFFSKNYDYYTIFFVR